MPGEPFILPEWTGKPESREDKRWGPGWISRSSAGGGGERGATRNLQEMGSEMMQMT